MKLSIIVPVYNVGSFLRRCILSLEDQDLSRQNYEIIVVNDGSTDNSLEVAHELTREFENIVLINQENAGVSAARNRGIACAKGILILFVDPDDYVTGGTFAQVVRSAEISNAEITYLGFCIVDGKAAIVEEILHKPLEGEVSTGIEAYFSSRRLGRRDPDRSWGILFRRDFLDKEGLRFTTGVPYLEDGEFMVRVSTRSHSCAFLPVCIYRRTIRVGSATNSSLIYSERSLDGFLKVVQTLKLFRESLSSEVQIQFVNHALVKFVLLAFQSCVSIGSFRRFWKVRKELGERKMDRLDLNGCVGRYYYLGLLYNLSAHLLFGMLIVKSLGVKFGGALKLLSNS